MFVKSLFILLAFGFSASLWASSLDGKSAHRDPNVSYEAYKAQAWFLSQGQRQTSRSAVDSAVSPDQAAALPVTTWNDAGELKSRFEGLRDFRFLQTRDEPNFLRRSSWLYPDDGCFARAALAIRNLSQWSFPVPNKVFVFGNLAVKTANSPSGQVTWWYHVAPIVEVAGQKYVLDPAINPKAALPLYDWLKTMTNDPSKLEVAICGAGSYTPYDACEKDTDGLEKSAGDDQLYYLDAEWNRLESLNRDPVKELGDNPPWL